jgi:anti-sigma factor RsiW
MTPRTDHVLDHVDDYLHDLLDEDAAAHVARHCTECAACAAALEEARKRLAALQSLPPSEAPGRLVRATVAGIGSYEARRRRRRRFVLGGLATAAAAVAAVLVGLQVHYVNLSASPTDLKVFGQTQLLAGAAASLRICLIDRTTGAALAGVPVRIGLRHRATGETVELARFTTDGDGTGRPQFRVPDWADAECELQVAADGQTHDWLAYPVKVRRSRQVMLSSDKPVYQPGQTVHVRSLALRRPDLRPVAGEDVTFTVTDAKGNVFFKKQDRNSDYGIASADCPLADEIVEGQYVIACTVGDTSSRLAVEVKKYVLPKFKVGLALDKAYYAPGEQVTATVEAGYFFGKPVAGTVELDASVPGENQPRYRGSAKTDASGKAVFSFRLPLPWAAPPQDGGAGVDPARGGVPPQGAGRPPQVPDVEARLVLRAAVTDAAGQKQSKEAATVVTTSPLKIEVIAENGTLLPGVANRVYVLTTYADGRPARTRVSGFPLQDGAVRTNELGVAEFDLTGEVPSLDLTVMAEDDNGVRGRKRVQLAGDRLGQDFLLRTDKAVYDGGDTMVLTVVSGGSRPLFVDLIKDGQTLLTETLSPADGRGELHIDLPPEASGTLQLCAYRVGTDGVPLSKTRTLYVRPAKGLQVKATTDRAEYRPGRSARVSFQLLDREGKPARGALSLAAVDEAVFSVLQQAPGSEARYFGVEQELLRPVQALYPWSPEAAARVPAAERERLEQALFARTVQTSSWTDPALRWHGRAAGAQDGVVVGEPGVSAPVHSGVPHTLSASSFVAETQKVELARQQGLHRVKVAWVVLAVSLVLLAYGLMWVYVRPLYVIAVLHLVGIVFVCGGLAAMQIMFGSSQSASRIIEDAAPRAPQAAPAGGVDRDGAWANKADVAHGGARKGSFGEPGPESVRVREEFPETLFWRPELITDDGGRASLDIDLADSITTWRLTASAVAADGRLGATQAGIKVFQPFFVDLNLPVALTRGDEVAVPVVVYSYLDKPQTVELTLDAGDWFESLEPAARKVELGPREVRSVSYRLRVKTVGKHALQVTAKGGDLADAIKRAVEVVPDGRRIEEVANGSLAQPAEVTMTVPENAVEGSAKVIVKVYPSSFSQLVEGLDGIFRMPSGCFEQTSSTTYPNVLALDYLRRTGQRSPGVRDKAEDYIHLGYQRLLGFEVSGGGFDWFGRPPANRTLTAYGLMEFQDMAKVHDVDPRLIERTRAWLLRQRADDGSWSEEAHAMHDDPTRGRGGEMAKLSTTAYVAWAVFGGPGAGSNAEPTRRYLLSHKPDAIDDSYIVALVANALLAIDGEGHDALPYLDRLEALKKEADGGKLCFWEQSPKGRTAFYGAGRGGAVETTALATLALLQRNHNPGTTGRALAWLVKQRGAYGTWPSTQATVLALKALVAGTAQPAGDGERRITIAWNGREQEVVIPADQAEVMKQIDLSAGLKPGTHRLTLTESTGTAAGYQVAFRYHVPDARQPEKAEPLKMELAYDRTELRVEDTVRATATVTNRMAQASPMVILDLPVPAGFAIDPDDFAALVKEKKIEKYQAGGRAVVVYLRGLDAGQSLTVKYGLRATMPVKVSVPPARAYEYYDADKQGTSAAARLTVTPRP